MKMKTLFQKNAFNSRVVTYLYKPYSLISLINNGIREKYEYAYFLLRGLFKDKGFSTELSSLMGCTLGYAIVFL